MNSPGHRRISPLCSFLSLVPGCKLRMFCLLGRLSSSLFSPLSSPPPASGFRLGEHGSGQWPHQISFIVCQLNLGKIAARFNSSERHNLAVKSAIQSTEFWKWERGGAAAEKRIRCNKAIEQPPMSALLGTAQVKGVVTAMLSGRREKHSVWSVMWVVGWN